MEHMNATSGSMQTIYCAYCSVQLSFPRGSMYIQCPRCQATQNPHAPQQTVCVGCATLLAHPANSLYIQCPKCMITQNARENRTNVNQSGGNLLHDSSAIPQKTPKKKKDPNAPKAASNAYMIFCKERRAELKSENPKLAFGKIGAKLGEIWRNLSSEEKRPYEERASGDRERYRKQMESYKSDNRSDGHPGIDTAGDDHDPNPALSKKRSADNFEDGNLNSMGNTGSDVKAVKRVKPESTKVGINSNDASAANTTLSPQYHDVGLYGHGFGNKNEHDSALGTFGNHVSQQPSMAVHGHMQHEAGNHDLLGISGIPDSDALGHSNNLGMNVHQGLEDSGSEHDLAESPSA